MLHCWCYIVARWTQSILFALHMMNTIYNHYWKLEQTPLHQNQKVQQCYHHYLEPPALISSSQNLFPIRFHFDIIIWSHCWSSKWPFSMGSDNMSCFPISATSTVHCKLVGFHCLSNKVRGKLYKSQCSSSTYFMSHWWKRAGVALSV